MFTKPAKNIRVKIKRFDTALPLPSYKSEGAVCVDLYSRVDVKIPRHEIGYIPLNVAIEVPKGCWVLLAARTSTHKLKILPVHGIGIGDWDFKGDNDEYVFPVYNFSYDEVLIERGMRVAQCMVLKSDRIDFEEVTHLGNPDRGKFGSTGLR